MKAPLDIITLNDLTQSERAYLDYLEEESHRPKRSQDLLSVIKNKIGQGIKGGIGYLTQGSISASSHLSSSKGYQEYPAHPTEVSAFFYA